MVTGPLLGNDRQHFCSGAGRDRAAGPLFEQREVSAGEEPFALLLGDAEPAGLEDGEPEEVDQHFVEGGRHRAKPASGSDIAARGLRRRQPQHRFGLR